MKRINYKSDFDFILHLKDCKDPEKAVPFPECDFDVLFWASNKAKAYTASYKDGVYTNCFRTDDGGMHFVFDNHRLGVGTLKWEPHFEHPNNIYPGNIQDLFSKEQLDIELVDGPGDCPTTAEVEIIAPFIKGDPFTYDDFTPEQIEEFKRPATEAAVEALRAAGRAESGAEAANAAAERAENATDSVREIETAVTNAEAEREKAETQRQTEETERQAAEVQRTKEFAGWKDEIDAKPDVDDLSNVIGDITSFEDDGQFEAVTGFTRADLKLDLFIDLFNAAAGSNGRYDPEHAPDKEHVFLLNGLWLTYAEAVAVYVSWHKGVYQNEALAKFAVRTNMPFRTQWNSVLERYAQGNVTVEVLYLPMVLIGNQCMQAFYGCTNLRKVYGLSHLRTNIDSTTFQGCSKLEYVGITHLRGNLDLRWSPLLGADSLRFIVSNADNTSAVTITVHAEVYAKLTDPALAEWSGLIAEAAAKNITFITA